MVTRLVHAVYDFYHKSCVSLRQVVLLTIFFT